MCDYLKPGENRTRDLSKQESLDLTSAIKLATDVPEKSDIRSDGAEGVASKSSPGDGATKWQAKSVNADISMQALEAQVRRRLEYIEAISAEYPNASVTPIGSGNEATCYLVETPDGARLTAKVREIANLDRDRFDRESKALKKIEHKNLCAYRGEFIDGERGIFVTLYDYAPGQSLDKLITEPQNRDALDIKDWLSISEQALDALNASHTQGILHRDLKPSHLIWDPASNSLKIIDFGLATDPRRDETVLYAGTPKYQNIAAKQGKHAPQSDLYALGVTLYELIGGILDAKDVRPGSSEPFKMADDLRILNDDKPLNVPTELKDFIRKMTSTDTSYRFNDAYLALRELKDLREIILNPKPTESKSSRGDARQGEQINISLSGETLPGSQEDMPAMVGKNSTLGKTVSLIEDGIPQWTDSIPVTQMLAAARNGQLSALEVHEFLESCTDRLPNREISMSRNDSTQVVPAFKEILDAWEGVFDENMMRANLAEIQDQLTVIDARRKTLVEAEDSWVLKSRISDILALLDKTKKLVENDSGIADTFQEKQVSLLLVNAAVSYKVNQIRNSWREFLDYAEDPSQRFLGSEATLQKLREGTFHRAFYQKGEEDDCFWVSAKVCLRDGDGQYSYFSFYEEFDVPQSRRIERDRSREYNRAKGESPIFTSFEDLQKKIRDLRGYGMRPEELFAHKGTPDFVNWAKSNIKVAERPAHKAGACLEALLKEKEKFSEFETWSNSRFKWTDPLGVERSVDIKELARLVFFDRDAFQIAFPLEASPTWSSKDASILQSPGSISVDRTGLVKIRLTSRGAEPRGLEVTLGKLMSVRDKVYILPIDYIIAEPKPTILQRIFRSSGFLTETEEKREKRESSEKLKREALASFTLPVCYEKDKIKLRPMRSFDPREGARSEGSFATVYLCSDGELRLFDFWGEEYDFSVKPNQDNPLLLFITDPDTSDGNCVNFWHNSYSIPEKFYGPLSGKFRATLSDGRSP